LKLRGHSKPTNAANGWSSRVYGTLVERFHHTFFRHVTSDEVDQAQE